MEGGPVLGHSSVHLFPVNYCVAEPAVESAVARTEPAQPDKLAGLLEMQIEYLFGDGVVKNEYLRFTGPLRNVREVFPDPFSAPGHAVGWHELPFKLHVLFFYAKHDRLKNQDSGYEMFRVG